MGTVWKQDCRKKKKKKLLTCWVEGHDLILLCAILLSLLECAASFLCCFPAVSPQSIKHHVTPIFASCILANFFISSFIIMSILRYPHLDTFIKEVRRILQNIAVLRVSFFFLIRLQEIAWQRLDELQPASDSVISRGITGLKLYMVAPFLE